MILIFGGAYQGKLDYAREKFNIKKVCDCSGGRTPEFDADAVYGTEGFVLECAAAGREAAEFFRENREKWQNKVIIITDVSQGIVPIDKELRTFREMNGRLMLYLSGEAHEVHRVFCGLGKRVK